MENNLTKKDYFKIFLLYGAVIATIPIIITEITWDIIYKAIGPQNTLIKELIESFFRAALLEEFFKYIGFRMADKKYNFKTEREFMIGAGMIGLAYAVIEKLVTGNAIAIILGILFPMHILWQMNQGKHFYAYKKAQEAGDNKKAQYEFLQSTLAIFLFHGCWDALISLSSSMISNPTIEIAEPIGAIMIIAVLVIGVIYTIKTIKYFISTKKQIS